jgi:hypothetical protein
VYRIGKVAASPADAAQPRPRKREQINGLAGQAELYAFVEALKAKSKAKIKVSDGQGAAPPIKKTRWPPGRVNQGRRAARKKTRQRALPGFFYVHRRC